MELSLLSPISSAAAKLPEAQCLQSNFLGYEWETIGFSIPEEIRA